MADHSAGLTVLPGKRPWWSRTLFESKAFIPEIPVWFFFVALVGLILRVLLFLDYRYSPFLNGLFLDAGNYWQWADRIAGGSWFPDGVFQQGPFYPYVLGLARTLFPGFSPSWVAAIQLFLNWITCLLFYPLLARTGSRNVGLLSASLALFFLPAVFFSLKILTIGLSLFLLQAGLLLFPWPPHRNRWRLFGAGFLWGMVCLSTPLLFPGIGVLTVFLILRSLKSGLRKLDALIVAAGLFLTILPVTVQNYLQDGSLVLISSNYGLTFYHGNNPRAGGTYTHLEGITADVAHQEDDSESQAFNEHGHLLNEGEVARHFVGKGLSFIVQNPGRYLILLGKKTKLLLSGADIPLEYFMSLERRDFLPFLWFFPVSGFVVLILFAFSGVRERAFDGVVAPFMVFALVQGMVCLVFYVSSRYSFPFQFYLIPAAAAGVFRLPKALKDPWSIILALLVLGSFLSTDVLSGSTAEKCYLDNLAALYAEDGKLEKAAEVFGRSIEINPEDSSTLTGMAQVLLEKGDAADALEYYREAARLDPDDIDIRLGLIKTYRESGRIGEAIAELKKMEGLNLHNERVQLFAADFYLDLGEVRMAEKEAVDAVRIEPRSGFAHYMLSLVFRREDRWEEATAELEEALDLDPSLAEAHNDLAVDYYFAGRYAAAAGHLSQAVKMGFPVSEKFSVLLHKKLPLKPAP